MNNEYLQGDNTETYKEGKIIKSLNKLQQEILSEEDYQKYLKLPAKELTKEIFNQVMTRKLNEIRKEYNEKTGEIGLEPLKYDENLEQIAEDFGQELQGTRWREKKYPHQDKDGSFIWDRIKKHGLKDYVKRKYERGKLVSLGENIVSKKDFSIEEMIEALMQSPGHRKSILSQTNIVGFSHTDPIVQVFAYK